MEYRDRDILSAIGLECQLCIGLKKNPHLHVSCPRLYSDTKNRGYILEDLSKRSKFRVSDTCIVLIFWLAKISFCNSQSRSSLINLILTEVTWTVHITFEMHTKQILE